MHLKKGFIFSMTLAFKHFESVFNTAIGH